jgi:hypothetical protein
MIIKIGISMTVLFIFLLLSLLYYFLVNQKKLHIKLHIWLYTLYPLLHNICYATIQGASGNEKTQEVINIKSDHNFFLIGLNEKNEWVKIDNNDFFIYFENSKSFNEVDTTLKDVEKKNKRVDIDNIHYRIVNCNVKENKNLQNYHLYKFQYENSIVGASINEYNIPTKWLQFNEWYERNWFAFWSLTVAFI